MRRWVGRWVNRNEIEGQSGIYFMEKVFRELLASSLILAI